MAVVFALFQAAAAGGVPVVVPSEVSAATVSLITSAIVTIIGTLVGGIIAIITALRNTKRSIEANAEADRDAAAIRESKLDHITVLVNGRYSALLQELADAKQLLAAHTGLAADHAAAEVAQQKADDQASRVRAASRASDRRVTADVRGTRS